MNILLVSYQNPLGKGGFEKQTIGFMREVIKKGHHIACIAFTKTEKIEEVRSQLFDSNLFSLGIYVLSSHHSSHSLWTKLTFWFSRNASDFLAEVYKETSKLIADQISSVEKHSTIDLVHVHGLKTAYVFPDDVNIPMTIDLLDSFSLTKKRELDYYLQKDRAKVIPAYLDYIKTLKIETDLLKKYERRSIFSMISSKDASFLQERVETADIQVISAATSQEEILCCTSEDTFDEEKTIAYCGFFSGLHNIEALLWLIDSIIPLVRKEYPNLILEVTGFGIPGSVYDRESRYSWVKITEQVENITDFMGKATLACWPFKYGAGVKTKVIESMALGKAIVSTTIGVEALTLEQRKGILTGDTAQSIAEAVIQLLSNDDERERLGEINKSIASLDFTWENRAQEYLRLYEATIQKVQLL